MNTKIKEILIVTIFLIAQTVIFISCGIEKSYIHMDEAYSLGLASYDKVEIQDNEDFYNTWHTKDYYDDYLSVQQDEVGMYSQVYENQKNDVHPPLYYLILRFAMGFNVGHFSKWPGVIVNIIIYIFITLVMYFILQKLLKNESRAKEKSIILAFVSSITMASLTNVLYIRMYALSTLNILIITLLHMKLLETKKLDIKLLIFIGLAVLAGVLTHYYYLFFLFMLYIIFATRYIKQKDYKQLISYTLTMAISGIISLVIFPYSIQHMFFGYRGQGVIDNLTNVSQFFMNILSYIQKIDHFGFNSLLFFIAVIFVGFYIYKINSSKREKYKRNDFIKIIALPTLFYFIIVSIASPWIELRYVMPISSLIFVLVIYYLYRLLNSIYKESISNIIISAVLVTILVSPFILNIEPESMYSDKKEIVNKMGNELNVPTLYFFNSQNNRFLDDILLFATVDESYIAKDNEITEENIKEILDGKDISNGIVIFINEGQENDDILDKVKNTMNFKSVEYLKRLNACDTYYVQ